MFSDRSAITAPTILVVDDDWRIRDLLSRWLTDARYKCIHAANAAEAWQRLHADAVQLVTLDVLMPGESGIDLLSRIKNAFPELPVLMLTALGHVGTAIEAMTAGACGYLVKPIQRDELLVQVERGLQWRQLWLERQEYTHSLERRVLAQTLAIRQAHEETIHRLVTATNCRDEETGAHVRRTGVLSEALARAAGWSSADAETLRLAAPMHDIGKIGIPDSILRKPGRLSAAEYEVMKTHTTIGGEILAGSESPVLQMAQQIALCHHERADGRGYPAGLREGAIPEAAQIVSIIDVYDALTHDRVYRPAYSQADALSMLQAQQGSQFSSALLATFFTILEKIQELSEELPDEQDVLAARGAEEWQLVEFAR